MVNYYAANTHYQTALNDCLRHLRDSHHVTSQAYANPNGLRFGGPNPALTQWDYFCAPQAATNPAVAFGNQPVTPQTHQTQKSGWFKKLLIGVGVSAGLYFVGKKAVGWLGKQVTEKVTETMTAQIVAQAAESLPKASAGKAASELISENGLKTVFETLNRFGVKPETIGDLLSTKGGQGLLNIGKSDFCVNILKNNLLNVARKYLPEPAVKILETQATPDNIRRLLDAGLLSSLLKAGGEFYGKNAGSLRDFLKANADPIAEQLARLTGFQKTSVSDALKQFQ